MTGQVLKNWPFKYDCLKHHVRVSETRGTLLGSTIWMGVPLFSETPKSFRMLNLSTTSQDYSHDYDHSLTPSLL